MEQKISKKMYDFINKVDELCFEYGYEIHTTPDGWTGKTNKNGEYDTIAIIGNNESVKLLYIDGDGVINEDDDFDDDQHDNNQEDLIKEYFKNGGDMFTIRSIETIRDGGTKLIICYDDNYKFYIHKDNNTFHIGYPTTDENLIKKLC
jgi:hypothetical protein